MPTRESGAASPAHPHPTALPNPDFKPLERILGPHFCADYMFMGTAYGISLYKNVRTRRYLNVDADGIPYRYERSTNSYQPIDVAEAIMAVFA
jgi:hypothetical protein